MSRSKKLWGATIGGILLLTSACGSDGGKEKASSEPGDTTAVTSADEVCTKDRVGGSLAISVPATSRTLDPFNGGGNTLEQGGTELQALYDKLVRFNPETGDFEPHLAEALEPNEDFSQWTLTLREGITFGDGTPLDAEALKASMDRHLDPEGGSALVAAAAQIKEVAAEGESTVVITLQQPWGGFPSLLAGAFGMVQNTALVESMGQEAFSTNPVGGGVGPYEVARYAPGEEIVLKAKSDYWGGPVCIEELRFLPIGSNQTAYDSLTNGELDAMVLGRDPVLLDEARNDLEGFSSYSSLQIGGDILLINSGADGFDTPGSDVRVRQAIAAAIDLDVIDNRVYEDTAVMSKALIPDEAELYEPSGGPEYDIELAKSLVEEVKADTGWDGKIRLDCNNTPVTSEVGITLKALLDAAGFDVVLNTQRGFTEMSALIRVEKDFDLACWGLSVHEENLWVTLNQYRSDAPNNAGNFADPSMDDALVALQQASTVEEGNEALSQLQGVWTELVPAVPLAAFEPALFWREDVKGVYFNTNVVAFFDKAFIAK